MPTDPLTRNSAPGPRWGLRSQTPVSPPFRRNRRHCFCRPDLWPSNSPDLNLVYMGCHPAASLSVAGTQRWRTETVITERMAWHWNQYHWECSWRVAGKLWTPEQLLWVTVLISIQSQAMKCYIFFTHDTMFKLYLWYYLRNSNVWLSKVVQQRT